MPRWTSRRSRHPQFQLRVSALRQAWLTAGFLSIAWAPSAFGQGEGTCANPILAPPFEDGGYGKTHLQLDTRLFSNNENDACTDSLATGPDVVVTYNVGCVSGIVDWSADFDAIVYLRSHRDGSCHAACVAVSRAGESLPFDAEWHWEGEEVICNEHFIIVDGLNGAAGNITLTFSEQGTSNPVSEGSWGYVKNRYR